MRENHTPPVQHKRSGLGRASLTAIVLILVAVLAFHLFFPILGITLVLSMAALGFIIASVVIFGIIALLFFIIPGAFVIALIILALAWGIFAIIIFPIVFPIVIPFLIVLFFIAYFRRHQD